MNCKRHAYIVHATEKRRRGVQHYATRTRSRSTCRKRHTAFSLEVTNPRCAGSLLLRNKGTAGVYIAKTFFLAGGGIAGFNVSIKELTGKPSDACPVFADRFGEGSRTASRILQEDFLLLQPGGIVGYEAAYKGCDVKHEGMYQITATYCACDLNTDRVKSAAQLVPLITGDLRSQATTFRVLEKHGAK